MWYHETVVKFTSGSEKTRFSYGPLSGLGDNTTVRGFPLHRLFLFIFSFQTTLELLVGSEAEIGLSIYFAGDSNVAYRQAYRRQTVVKIYPGAFYTRGFC
jgi:hypothetical protein